MNEETPRGRRDLSLVNFGLIMAGRQPATIYKSEWFNTPYDKGVEILQKNGAKKEDIAKVINPDYLNDAHESVSHWNGVGEEINWPQALEDAYKSEEMGNRLVSVGKRLKENQDVDLLSIYGELQSVIAHDSSGMTLLEDLNYKNFDPWIESGWDVIDSIIGGIPKHGLIVVAGETKVGKSFFLGKMVNEFLHKHTKKKAAIFTLEMPSEEYAQRTVQMYPNFAELGKRVYIDGSVRNIDEIVLKVSTMGVDFVGIDFVDWLVKEASEPAYTYIYKRCVEMARLLKIPVCLLAQPHREGVKNKKFLTKFDIRWTGMAENSAWMLIGLQNVNSFEMDDDKYETFDENHEYLLFLALRGQWKKQQGPGAIILECSKRKWSGKAIGNRLWLPSEGKSRIGNHKNKSKD